MNIPTENDMAQQALALRLARPDAIVNGMPAYEGPLSKAARQEQEPVANQFEQNLDMVSPACQHSRYSIDVQEQTGHCFDCGAEGRMRFVVYSETAPSPAREWVELTDDDFRAMGFSARPGAYAAISAKLKERNHGAA